MPAPRAASCFAKKAVRQGRPEPPPPPFQSHPSPRLRQIKGGGLQPHQASRAQQIMRGGERRTLTERDLADRRRLHWSDVSQGGRSAPSSSVAVWFVTNGSAINRSSNEPGPLV